MEAVQRAVMTAACERPTGLERLGLRISAMINSPLAQSGRKVLIHQLDTDSDQDWDAIMELLAETLGLDLTFLDDGSVSLKWDKPTEHDCVIGGGEELDLIQHDRAALF